MTSTPPPPRPTGLHVIGAGFGRTATLSLKTALEELGIAPCYHMTEAFAHPEHASRWSAAARGEAVDWQALLAGYGAAVDWPACTYYKELLAAFPQAKVLLTVRDPERWYDSVKHTIHRVRQLSSLPAVRWLLKRFFPRTHLVLQEVHETFWEKTFQGRFLDRTHAIGVMNQHIEEVRRHVPADRLLVFRPQEGWGPLCAFLGLPVPANRPFPRGHGRVNYFLLALRILTKQR